MLRIFVLLFLNIYLLNSIEVKISNGRLEGKEVTTNNTTLHLFKRIPFAQPPLGQLRFQKPQPVNTWTGTLNATEYGDACLGIRSNSDRPITMSEDCLNINVFTSHFCLNNGGCPVFVMIHGGVFAFGNSIQYNDTQILEKFVKHDIIFVLPAMRVGFFGFADFGDDYEFAPYNVGLYDIIANLEWIQHNIQSFGGNSSRVTLMGYSAGATAIQFLMSSPQLQSHQLFSQAMLSSGQPVLYQHRSQRLTTKFVEISNCSQGPIRNQTFTVQEKLDCLRNKSADQLNELTKTLANSMQHNGPQSNQHLFSAENYFEMASKRTPIKLLVMTALNEMDIAYDASSSVRHVCAEFLQVLNYYQKETIDKCVERYNTTLELSNDFYHAIAASECHLNNQKLAAPCYLGIFSQVNHSNHANDMLYLVGQHLGKVKEFTINDMLMDDFYPQVVRNFVNGQQPNWLPTNKKGKGYLHMNSNVLSSDNKQWPEFVQNEWYEEDSVSFFLEHLLAVEQDASRYRFATVESLDLIDGVSTTHSSFYESQFDDSLLDAYTSLATVFFVAFVVLIFAIIVRVRRERQKHSQFYNRIDYLTVSSNEKQPIQLYGSI